VLPACFWSHVVGRMWLVACGWSHVVGRMWLVWVLFAGVRKFRQGNQTELGGVGRCVLR